MLPTFSSYESGSATGAAARRQNARTHMSFDFHGVISISSRPCPSHVDRPTPCRPSSRDFDGVAGHDDAQAQLFLELIDEIRQMSAGAREMLF